MRMETFIRKSLGLKAHTVVAVDEDETVPVLIVHIERVRQRQLRCGECGRPAAEVAPTRRPARRWRDLAMREHVVELVYAPYRVWCRRWLMRASRTQDRQPSPHTRQRERGPQAEDQTRAA